MKTLILAFLSAVPLVRGAAQSGSAVRPGEFTVQVLTFANGAFAQSILVETGAHVLVFDAGLIKAHGEAIAAAAARTQKPVAALFLTHAHLDHYGGAGVLRGAGVPLITSPGVARQIAEYDSVNFARFGARIPPGPRAPDRLLSDGQSFTVDGVTVTIHDLGPGEAYTDTWFMIEAGARRAAVLGDLVMYGIPPFVQSGHSGDWLRSLERLRRAVPPGTPVYLGHDSRGVTQPGGATGAEVIDLQADRLRQFRAAVNALTGGGRLLTLEEIEPLADALLRQATENHPDYRFLITTSANVLAAELILERQRLGVEDALRAALAARRRQP